MSRAIRLLIAFVAAVSLAATLAFAQPKDPPSPLFASPYDWGAKGDAKAFANLLFFAHCLVHVERGPASKFLRVDYTPKDWRGPTEDLVAGAGLCTTDLPAMKLDFPYLRGALIEALYDEDILNDSGKPLIVLGSLAPGTAGAPPMLGQCLVNTDPSEAAALLKTNIASADQTRVIGELKSAIDQCARGANVKTVYPEMLRFQIAEELYRRQIGGREKTQ